MADKKISALPAATTPLAGTEVLPIVQGGSTVKVSIANVTAGRAVSTGALNVVAADATLDNAYSLKSKLVAGTAVSMMRRNSSNEVAIDEDGYGTKIGFGGRYNFAGGGNFTVGIGNVIMGTAGKGIDFSANANAPGMTSELLNWYETGTWTGTLTAATPPTIPITKTGRYTRIGNQITIAIEFDNVDTSGASGAMEVTGLPFAATAAGYGPVMKSGIGTDVIMAGVYSGLSKVIFSDAGTMNTTNIVAAAGVYLRFSATYYV